MYSTINYPFYYIYSNTRDIHVYNKSNIINISYYIAVIPRYDFFKCLKDIIEKMKIKLQFYCTIYFGVFLI